ncbi:DMT family transporter [Dongia soli]|uniref:DMT family transporter n=1 Tax=Dongia soli TaxID=600628 RepID=A0ABU5EAZ5_9PROT|nr:DMT family transporter [Dongia soli]MDY0883155.1 DMT family transporter [Dongia soli]
MSQQAKMHRHGFLPLGCLVTVGSLLGVTANLVKVAHRFDLPLLGFVFWSVLFAGLILVLISALARQAPRLSCHHIEYYLFSGLVSIGLPNALSFSAVPHVGVSFISLATAFPPLVTYLLALGMHMERYQWQRALGVFCGLAGALALALSQSWREPASWIWVLAAFAAPILLSIGNIYRTRRWPAGATSLSLAPGMLLGGALVLFGAAWLSSTSLGFQAYDRAALLLLACQSLIIAITYILFFFLQYVAGPVYLSQIGSVAAIVGSLIAILVLGESASYVLLIAAIFILVGVFLVNRARPAGK